LQWLPKKALFKRVQCVVGVRVSDMQFRPPKTIDMKFLRGTFLHDRSLYGSLGKTVIQTNGEAKGFNHLLLTINLKNQIRFDRIPFHKFFRYSGGSIGLKE
jgi:hypothetical protein